jgi:hypothetical protein
MKRTEPTFPSGPGPVCSPLFFSVLLLGGIVASSGAAGAASPTAQYTVRFESTWSATTHPVDFPSNAHFSPLVGGTHDARVRFWRAGEPASAGIQAMAEAGQISPLDDEIKAAIGAGRADRLLLGPDTDSSPDIATLSFTARREFPLVTLVTMVAPSPDWFVGVADLPLLVDGEWVEERVVRLVAWDAGTDSGATFRTPNQVTTPRRTITHITNGPLGAGEPHLGTFTFTRTDITPPPPVALASDRFEVSASWEKPDGTRGAATPVGLTPDSGYLWFFDPANVELVVNVIDACSFSNRYWVFAAGLTNLGVELRVEDTRTGRVKTYRNPVGRAFAPLQDTGAFATCP